MIVLVKKNHIGCAIFTLISINQHYCAMSQTLYWPPFLNKIIFFKILFQKCKWIYILLLRPKFHQGIPLGKWFNNFGHLTIFAKRKCGFGSPFRIRTFFNVLFLIYGCFRCIQVWCKFRTEIQFNQFNLYFHIKNTQTSRSIKITKKQNMEEKTGRPMRPDYCPSLKKKVTKHPNNHIPKPNKTRRQNEGLCSKERNYS